MSKWLDKLGNALRYVLPLDNAPKAIIVLFIFVVLWLVGMAMHKRAFGAEVQASTGAAVVRGAAPALNVAWDIPAERGGDTVRASMTLIGHSTFQGVQYPNNYAFSVQYITGFGHFDLGLGPSWMENPYPYNGTRVNFNLMAGYRFTRAPVTLWYDHFSCGGACWPNYGRDVALVGWRF